MNYNYKYNPNPGNNNKTNNPANKFPRALSTGSVVLTNNNRNGSITSSSSGNISYASTPSFTYSPGLSKTTNPNPDPGDDVWGDDEEDDLLFQATQITEKITGISTTTTNPLSLKPDLNEEVKPTPAENFALRRQMLEDKSQENGTLGLSEKKYEETIKALNEEKTKLKESADALSGEIKNVRKTNLSLKAETQDMVIQMFNLKRDYQKSKDELGKEYQKSIKGLEGTIDDLKKEVFKIKMSKCSPNTSRLSNTSLNTTLEMNLDSSPIILTTEESLRQKQPLKIFTEIGNGTTSVPTPPKSTRSVGCMSMSDERESAPKEEILTKYSELKVGLEDPDLKDRLTQEELRDNVLLTIERMVSLRFEMILPILESVVKRAPREIMRRLVRSCNESKSAFPEVVDYMFQWGIDKERQKIRAAAGIKESKPPILPFQYVPAIHFHEIKRGIEIRFRDKGVWGALFECREWLQKVLKSLEGKGRFRMYETRTLTNFWRLLFWANELWRCVVFEEENKELIEENKEKWAKELEGWTGLVLKCDWRDYFIIELEVEVRKLSLNILESIVIAGYFEKKKNRYEILYRIIKDVLSIDVFREARNIQHVLKILTWSISDLDIMRYFCFKTNDGYCIARLLGDCMLKYCRQESDQMTIVLLYLDFMYLLGTLMRDKPTVYHQSKIAKLRTLSQEKLNQEEQNQMETQRLKEHDMMAMDSEPFLASQFACPVKYTTEPIFNRPSGSDLIQNSQDENTTLEMDTETILEELDCWLDPSKFEDPFGRLKLCQCRKTLMGSGVFLLQILLDFWCKDYIKYEESVELLEQEENKELESLQKLFGLTELERKIHLANDEQDDKKVTEEIKAKEKRLKFLQEKKSFLEQFLPNVNKILHKKGEEMEWNWDDVIRKRKEICALTELDCFPDWLMEQKRLYSILDLCISKGIFMFSFLETRSDNLAAAIGTEAYKVFMNLLPHLRSHVDRLDLNRVDRNILLSITTECEEEMVPEVVGLDQNSQVMSQFNFRGTSKDYEVLEEKELEIPFTLETLQEISQEETRSLMNKNDLKKLQNGSRNATSNSPQEIQSQYEALYEFISQEEFLH